METILNEYNKFNAKPLLTFEELENVSEIVHCETVSQTKTEIIFKRFCSCCARSLEKKLHPVHYYVIDKAELDENGDAGELIPVEYGLL